MHIPHLGSTLPSSSLSLLLAYTLFISLCAPFAIRETMAASAAKNGVSPVASAKPVTQTGTEPSRGVLVRCRSAASQQDVSTLLEAKGLRRVRRLRGRSGLELLDLLNDQNAEAAASDLRLNEIVEFARSEEHTSEL